MLVLRALGCFGVLGALGATSGCSFAQNTHLIRHADTLAVNGVPQAARVMPHADREAGFTVEGADLVVQASGRQLQTTTVRLGFVVPVQEGFPDSQVLDARLVVAIQVSATAASGVRLRVDGQLTDAQGQWHRPALVASVDGVCDAPSRPERIHPLAGPSFEVAARERGCLYLAYDLEPRLTDRLKLSIGSLTAGPSPAARQLELSLGSALTQQITGH
ncbi:hypothetical protein [Roseateles sp. YR242]|uniref:hypothetical protein n=1 Tax=Roseateles sp. YR242 TaxID=1855305 RepID=UPI001160132B|nr:hypothetical protein [Roseateles sp. YR242]